MSTARKSSTASLLFSHLRTCLHLVMIYIKRTSSLLITERLHITHTTFMEIRHKHLSQRPTTIKQTWSRDNYLTLLTALGEIRQLFRPNVGLKSKSDAACALYITLYSDVTKMFCCTCSQSHNFIRFACHWTETLTITQLLVLFNTLTGSKCICSIRLLTKHMPLSSLNPFHLQIGLRRLGFPPSYSRYQGNYCTSL